MEMMHKPPHPGQALREDILLAFGRSISEAAEQIGVTRTLLSRIVNEKSPLSAEMALRIEQWIGVENGGNADLWVAQQAAYDLWKARERGVPRVERAHEVAP
jgi:addiction module HigA family antidote